MAGGTEDLWIVDDYSNSVMNNVLVIDESELVPGIVVVDVLKGIMDGNEPRGILIWIKLGCNLWNVRNESGIENI